MSRGGYHALRVASVEQEAPDVRSYHFTIPKALEGAFHCTPGQHIGIRVLIGGTEYRRSYTVSDTRQTGTLRITVKKKKGGAVSPFLYDSLEAGSIVEVTTPAGSFVVQTDPAAYRTYFLFAAGSGITPLFAMANAILKYEPRSFVRLLYGSRNQASIIFRSTLEAWLERFPTRLHVQHVWSHPEKTWRGLGAARRGIIDADAVRAFIDEHPPPAQTTQYLVCGPGNMYETIRATLNNLGVPDELIRTEHFGPRGDTTPIPRVENAQAATLHVEGLAASSEIQVEAGQTLLEGIRKAKIEPPFSCESGICGTCRATLLDGTATMRANMALTPKEVEKGELLTCQAVPTSDLVRIRFG